MIVPSHTHSAATLPPSPFFRQTKFFNKKKFFFDRIWEIVLCQSQSAANHVLCFGDRNFLVYNCESLILRRKRCDWLVYVKKWSVRGRFLSLFLNMDQNTISIFQRRRTASCGNFFRAPVSWEMTCELMEAFQIKTSVLTKETPCGET